MSFTLLSRLALVPALLLTLTAGTCKERLAEISDKTVAGLCSRGSVIIAGYRGGVALGLKVSAKDAAAIETAIVAVRGQCLSPTQTSYEFLKKAVDKLAAAILKVNPA